MRSETQAFMRCEDARRSKRVTTPEPLALVVCEVQAARDTPPAPARRAPFLDAPPAITGRALSGLGRHFGPALPAALEHRWRFPQPVPPAGSGAHHPRSVAATAGWRMGDANRRRDAV